MRVEICGALTGLAGEGISAMLSVSRARRAGATLGVLSLAALAVTGLATPRSAAAAGSANPYSPATGHSYRHGVLPSIGTLQKMKHYAASHPSAVTV
jgi:hypothetical protein